MKILLLPMKGDCGISECRNGQIWNPGVGQIPCPNCQAQGAK